MLMAGVPRSFALTNMTLTGVLTLGLGVWWLSIPLGLMLHTLATFLTGQDPMWFDVGKRHLQHRIRHRYLGV